MKRIILIILAISLPSLGNATDSVQARAQLVVAVQDDSVSFGTDSGTTSSPNAGMDTMPTKQVGSEENTVNQDAPVAKPGQAPAFDPPPAFAKPPAFTPPASQNGNAETQP